MSSEFVSSSTRCITTV